MSNEKANVLDLMPATARYQLIMEVFEFLEKNKRRHLISFDKEEPQEPADQNQIDEIVNTIIP